MKRIVKTWMLSLGFCAGFLLSAQAQAKDSYQIDIRIISAQPNGNGIDPALRSLSRDLQAMPYKSYKLLDSHKKKMRKGESVSMQFPGAKRFLNVKAEGRRGDKLTFAISIDALRFRTRASIPDKGTLVIGGPKHQHGVILLALTASEH